MHTDDVILDDVLGFVIQALHAVFHVAVAFAIIQPEPWVAAAAGVLFAAGRMVTTMSAPVRHAILRGMERRALGRLASVTGIRALPMTSAALLSRVSILVAGIWMLTSAVTS